METVPVELFARRQAVQYRQQHFYEPSQTLEQHQEQQPFFDAAQFSQQPQEHQNTHAPRIESNRKPPPTKLSETNQSKGPSEPESDVNGIDEIKQENHGSESSENHGSESTVGQVIAPQPKRTRICTIL